MPDLIMIGNPRTQEMVISEFPPIAQEYFKRYVAPNMAPVFKSNPRFEQDYQETSFGIAWAAAAAAAAKIAKDWYDDSQIDCYTKHGGWMQLADSIKQAGGVVDNPKFLYCCCGGQCYRVSINDSCDGSITYLKRNKNGTNTRFDCSLMPSDIMKKLPCRGAGSDYTGGTYQPGGGGSGGGGLVSHDKGEDDSNINWGTIALYGGGAIVAALLLKMILGSTKRRRR